MPAIVFLFVLVFLAVLTLLPRRVVSGNRYRIRRKHPVHLAGECGTWLTHFHREALLFPLEKDLWECHADLGGAVKLTRSEVNAMLQSGWEIAE